MRFVAGLGLVATALPSTARAGLADRLSLLGDPGRSHDSFLLPLLVGSVLVTATVALLHLSSRRRAALRETSLSQALSEVTGEVDRARTFLAVEPQIIIVWGLTSNEPTIEGDPSLVSDVPILRRVVGFGSWLPPDQAQQLDGLVARLRERGEAFRLPVVSLSGRHLETEGRAIAGRAVVRIRDVSGDRLEVSRLREALAQSTAERDALRGLLDQIRYPAWSRDALGRLTWVNTAYVRAVEASDARDALTRGLELLESPAREAAAASRARLQVFRDKTAAVMAGWRSSLDVVEVPREDCTMGIAFDTTELEAVKAELKEALAAHARTLDQLATAVAIFDRRKKLVFYNEAYCKLFALEETFLEQHPTESEILDRLRARRMLPEQANYREWKERHLARYQSPETPAPEIWYLPDGRALRVVVNANPQSGVTYLFDDLTERYRLETAFIEQSRVQTDTLDTLKEGVAVFGTDGRLKLSNAAFARLWRLEPTEIAGEPHIDRVAALCARLAPEAEPWSALRGNVAGLHDRRLGIELRIARRDGTVVDATTAPLTDGSTLITFTDTTASVNVERALTERNKALIETEQLRNDFVHHVSYELRSPLTSIIGFIQLLGDGSIGPLNPKQSEYVGYVMKSSAALLAIINDILDLATIDTGVLELHLKRIDVLETIRSAAEGVQDRLADASLSLQIVALPEIGSFKADAKRVRQVLFNLLSNAIGFSAPGQTVTLAALRRGDEIVFKVSDQGRGIPAEVIAHVFDRFHSNTIGSRHRGVGLGLSIVKSFVELHGGRVLIDSAPGVGTTVTCIFPTHDEKLQAAEQAEE
ncbi:MAG: PAS-domain containing protein [Beijerinckiaceae bacterium]|nr:PAS-domain containing protein [Beijerinckiaceae bacterium]